MFFFLLKSQNSDKKMSERQFKNKVENKFRAEIQGGKENSEIRTLSFFVPFF